MPSDSNEKLIKAGAVIGAFLSGQLFNICAIALGAFAVHSCHKFVKKATGIKNDLGQFDDKDKDLHASNPPAENLQLGRDIVEFLAIKHACFFKIINYSFYRRSKVNTFIQVKIMYEYYKKYGSLKFKFTNKLELTEALRPLKEKEQIEFRDFVNSHYI